MKLSIPEHIFSSFHNHLFHDDLEQGAFLFGMVENDTLAVSECYLVPPSGWDVQLEVYLEMKDSERAHIMHMAVQRGASVVDCHSHPGAQSDVWFSPSDVAGISAFAQYAKWKLRGRAYVATVWGETSVDAVHWSGTYAAPESIAAVEIQGQRTRALLPTGSWFREARAYHRKSNLDE